MTTEGGIRQTGLSRLIRIFGARRVFVAYAICVFITAVTITGSIISSLVTGANSVEKMIEHVALCVAALALMSVPVVMHRRYHFYIPWFIHAGIAILILSHFVLGEIHRFYDYIFLFDKILHITGGVVIALCGFSVVQGFSKTEDGHIRLSPFFIAMFSFCFAITLLTLWEIFEYAVDSMGGFNMQRWRDNFTEIYDDGIMKYLVTNPKQGSGLIDTMTDLIVGTIGAAVVSVLGGLMFKKNPHDTQRFLIVRKNPAEESGGRAKKSLG